MPFGGYLYNGQKLPLVKCLKCSLMFIDHSLSESQITSFYDKESYFDSEYGGGADKDYKANKLELQKKARNVLKVIKKFTPSGKLLEIGSAGGYFMLTAQNEFGYKAMGVEISRSMCDLATGMGLNTFCGQLKDLPERIGNFDIIYLGDVLEHITDPIAFSILIRKRLNKDGIMVLELPLTYNLTLSGFFIGLVNMTRGRFGYQYFLPAQHRSTFIPKPPYHLLQFNGSSMDYFFNCNGFKTIYIKTYDGEPKGKFSGSLYWLLKKVCHFITSTVRQSWLGDRAIVITRKHYSIST